MLDALTLLLLVQLVGEVLVRAAGVPIPGPVLGAAILAAVLAWRGIGAELRETARVLLRHLPLLFVPAGVGIVRQWGVLTQYWLALSVALVVSTAATITVTVLVFDWVSRRLALREPAP